MLWLKPKAQYGTKDWAVRYATPCESSETSRAVVLIPTGNDSRQEAAREAAETYQRGARSMLALKQWIWFIGAVAWYVDSAINLHYGARSHALLALLVATMFFVAGMVWVKTPKRP